MNQEQYLNYVLGKLETAIEELSGNMEDRRAEIAKMQEYYWESYNEYDEFGYEKFDNDRLLREEMDSHGELVRKYARYVKMKDSPYFAAVTFRYEDEEGEETYYIGIALLCCFLTQTLAECDIIALINFTKRCKG